MIDLHSHTNESDGTFSPAELVQAGLQAGLEALAITDHDTFAGYDKAAPLAREAGLRLVCGVELSTKVDHPRRQTVHLLAYFGDGPAPAFVEWLNGMQASRRDRNARLSAKLSSMGMDVPLEEVEALGRNMAGRPHFARIMVRRGYVSSYREAFDLYLDESAPGYVDRDEPTLTEAVQRVAVGGGLSSLAHPIRLGVGGQQQEEALIATMALQGLHAIEAYHSDHTPTETERYITLAQKYGLKISGGSDFHGDNKPGVMLGTGPGHLNIPASLLSSLGL
jgi:predicted metal-dependent phosphoesterase TrpH